MSQMVAASAEEYIESTGQWSGEMKGTIKSRKHAGAKERETLVDSVFLFAMLRKTEDLWGRFGLNVGGNKETFQIQAALKTWKETFFFLIKQNIHIC